MKNIFIYLSLAAFLSVSLVATAQNRLYVRASATGGNTGTSWTDAFTNLQVAIQSTQAGDEVWVAVGTYLPTDDANRDSSFNLPSGSKLYGGFSGTETNLSQRDWQAHPTVLSGDIGVPGDSSDNSYNILYLDNPDSLTIVDGLIFRFGYAGYTGNDQAASSRYRSGGAIYIMADWEAYATVSNCRFERNLARNHGGAVYVNGAGSFAAAPTIRDCVFEHNIAGQDGGGVARIGNSTLERLDFVGCVFRENRASRYGGGLYFQDANVNSWLDVQGCTFVKNEGLNRGGGVALRIGRVGGGTARIKDCRFEENQTPSISGALSFLNQTGLPCQEVLVEGCMFLKSPGFEIQYDLLGTPSSALRIIESRFEDHLAYQSVTSGDIFSELIFEKDTFINVPFATLTIANGVNKTHYNRTVFNNIREVCTFQQGQAQTALFTNSIFENATFPNGIINVDRDNYPPVFSSCNFINCSINYFLIGEHGASVYFDNCLFNGNNIAGSNTHDLIAYANNCSFDDVSFCDKTICANNLFNLDPLFRDPVNHDYSLLPCSPLLNAGSNAAASGILTDIAGNPRIQGGTVDIGAYESPAFSLAAAPQVQPACVGATNGSITVNPVFGCEPYTYTWLPAAGSGPELNNLPPGSYLLTITDGSGRQILDTLEVAEAPSPHLNPMIIDVQCTNGLGGSISAGASSGTAPYHYQWQPLAADTAMLNHLSPGAYALTVVDAQGCQDSAKASIALLGMLTPSIDGQSISCPGAADGWLSLTPSTGAAPFTWIWTGWAGKDAVAQPLGPGQYSVTVTDAYGCTASNTFPFMNDPASISATLNVIDQTNLITPNGAAIVTSTSGGSPFPGMPPYYQYDWSTGEMGSSIAGLSAGTYTITVTDSHGCTSVQTFEVQLMVGTGEAAGEAILLYPNPAADWLRLVLPAHTGKYQVELSDASGRVVLSQALPAAVTECQLDLRGLSGGSYFITLRNEAMNAVFTGKVLKR